MHIRTTPIRQQVLVINGNDSDRTLIDCMMYAIQLGLDSKKLSTVIFYLSGGDFSKAPNLFGDTASLEEATAGQTTLTVDVPSLIKLGKKRGQRG